MRLFAPLILILLTTSASAAISDSDVGQAIIRESLASYPGPCPCPYNIMRNGRSCGNVSAYVRPGGYAPICYERDVTPGMIQRYRQTHGN